jgi:Ni,Fe-hydrogenase III small subunit
MKNLKDGKSTTLTIKVTQKTRDQAQALYEKIDANMTFSTFLGEMVKKGLVFEEIWRQKEQAAIEEFAQMEIDIPGVHKPGKQNT